MARFESRSDESRWHGTVLHQDAQLSSKPEFLQIHSTIGAVPVNKSEHRKMEARYLRCCVEDKGSVDIVFRGFSTSARKEETRLENSPNELMK